MSALEQAMKDTATLYIRSYVDAGTEKNPRLVSKYTTDDCKRHIGPSNMLIAMGAPPELTMTNTEYEATFRDLRVVSVDSYNVHNLTVDATNRKAACWSVLRGKFIDGTPYDRNHSWFFDFNEDGSKIKEMYNISDMHQALEYQKKVAAVEEQYPPKST
jgi:hypothetical protein